MALGELILARPAAESNFPVDEVEAHVASQRFFFRDPASGLLALCGSVAGTQFARMRFLTEPDEPMPPVVLIRVAPELIQISLLADEPALNQGRDFAVWLLRTYPSAIFTPEGADISQTFL
jgi:hypothetical protein